MTPDVTELQLLELRKPMELKWRVQRAFPNKENPTHVIMVGYSDARDIQDKLDSVLGASKWQTRYFECKGKQFCEIGIKIDGEWVWKGDNGTESQTERQKGETSDSFKRAAVHWGINRYAYQVGEVKVPCRIYSGKPYPCDQIGNFLKGDSLFETCNKLAKVEDMEIEFDKLYFEKSNSQISDHQAVSLQKEMDRVKNYITNATTRKELLTVLDFCEEHGLIEIYDNRINEIENATK